MAAAGTCWEDLRIVGPTFAGEQAWKTYATDFDGTQGSGVSGEGSEPKKFYFVSFVFGKLQFRS